MTKRSRGDETKRAIHKPKDRMKEAVKPSGADESEKAEKKPSEEAPPSLTWSGARTWGGTDDELVGRERPGVVGEEWVRPETQGE